MRNALGSRSSFLALLIGSCVVFSATAPAKAVDFYIENINLTQSASPLTGSLDVYVATGSAIPTTSYSVEVISSAATGSDIVNLVLLAPTWGTSNHFSAPYINDNTHFFPVAITLGDVVASDSYDGTNLVTVNNGYGLCSIPYEIAANTVGTYYLDFSTDYGLTYLADAGNNPIVPGMHRATITVSPAAAETPEPASLAVLALGAVGLLARRRR